MCRYFISFFNNPENYETKKNEIHFNNKKLKSKNNFHQFKIFLKKKKIFNYKILKSLKIKKIINNYTNEIFSNKKKTN